MELINLALEKSVLVSSSYSDSAGTADPKVITNGNVDAGGYKNGGWWSPTNGSNSAYAIIDLGQISNINYVRFYVGNTPKVSIAVSTDNIKYTTIADSLTPEIGWNEIDFDNTDARYVKFFGYVTNSYGYFITQMYEVEVYSKGNKTFLLKSNNKVYSLQSEEQKYETKMTSNITPAPYVVSASSQFNENYAPFKAFNGTVVGSADAWLTSSSPNGNEWIQIKLDKPKMFDSLSITSRDYSGNNQIFPSNFSIQASNDGINFVTLAKFDNQIAEQKVKKDYKFKNSNKFLYYRIGEIKNINYVSSYLGFGEIYFEGNSVQLLEIPEASHNNFLGLGMSEINGFNSVLNSKNYILQDTVSEDTNGLWKQELNRKPLSIKFE